jgi:nitrate reductase molybdenum cofactor assembly chaperone NarJ/NarW
MRARRQEASRVSRQAAAVCLGYPDADVIASSGLLRAALAECTPHAVENFEPLLAFWDSADPSAIQTHYVDVFDLSRKHALYLSYWTDGDTRRRGEVLAAFKQRYRRSGFLVDTREASCPTICPWSWSTQRSSIQPMAARCSSSTAAALSCCGWL